MAKPIRTKDELNKRLDEIRLLDDGTASCNETMHYKQDMLLRDVLVGIANGAENPQSLAGRALEVFNIEFTRWYS